MKCLTTYCAILFSLGFVAAAAAQIELDGPVKGSAALDYYRPYHEAQQDDRNNQDDLEAQDPGASPSDRFGPRANLNPPSDDDLPIPSVMPNGYLDQGMMDYEAMCYPACGRDCWSPSPFAPHTISVNGDCYQVGGWLSGGMTFADHSVGTTSPIAFVNPTDEFLFNQVWLFAERKARTQGCGWDWGFRVDYVFGADGPDTQARGDGGWDFGWNTGGTGGDTYGSAIPQLYAEAAYNDLTVKVGHFFTIMGYEQVPAPSNFFYSHSYAMNYGSPLTQTGVLAEYSSHQNVTWYAGYVFGWDSGFSNILNADTFLGGVCTQISDELTLTYTVNAGDFGDGIAANNVAGNAGDIFLQSFVAQLALTSRWQYVMQTDYGRNSGAGSGSNNWYGLTQYLMYTINESWRAGLRYEVFRDDAGVSGRISNNPETYQAWSLGTNWQPYANLRIRPELRWDYVNHSTGPFGGQNSLFTFGVDAIFQF